MAQLDLVPAPTAWPAGGGECGRLLRAHDWSRSPLGPIADWSPALRTATEIVLMSPVPIVMLWGPDGVMIYNDAYSDFAGSRHPQLLGSKVLEGWPEVADLNARVMAAVRGRGETLSFVDQPLVLHRHGRPEQLWTNLDYSPVFEADGRPEGVFAIVVETTQRVLAERERTRLLAQAQSTASTLQQWFEQAPGFVLLLRGPEHVVELANQAYFQLVGHRALLGRPLFDALPETRDQGYDSLLDEVLATGRPFVGHAMRLLVQREPAGAPDEVYLDFVYQPVLDAAGRVDGIFVQGHEVTERVEALDRLQASEERFRLAVASSSLGTFDLDLDDGSATLSTRAQELFDLFDDDQSVQACWQRVHPDDLPHVQATVRRARAGEDDGRYAMQHRVRRADGSVRWVDIAGRATRQRDRRGVASERLTGVMWDVTEEHALLEQLREADRRKDEFLATLAHELRNPLAPIRTAAHLLSMPSLPPQRLQYCSELIQRQSRTMALLLDDLLDVSRITRNKLELRRAHVEVAEVVESAIETARPWLEAKQHVLAVHLPDDLPAIEADPLRVAQVLTNLLTNAAKYTDVGGHVRLDVEADAQAVRFAVVDDGVGIAPDVLPALFGMFQQVHGTLDRSQGGLGIGLALSRALAELHGGSLTASSAGIGRGATFRLELPLGRPAAAATPAAPAPLAPTLAPHALSRARPRVLVADDNADAANTLAMVLEHAGCEVHVVHDGRSALALAQRVRPVAAFLDIGMPGLDGYALARRLRESPAGRTTLLVATTGYGQEDDRRQAEAAGFDDHLTKPVDPLAPLALLRARRIVA